MSDNNMLQRLTARPDARDTVAPDPDGSEDFGAFGWVRGPARERAIMLELRAKSGNIMAVGYSWIDRMEFAASSIRLYAGESTIVISGRNLNTEVRPQIRLYQGLTRHRVSFIQEADHPTLMAADKNSVVIESIRW